MAAAARLVGLDVARALALLGMVATHVLPETTPDGDITWVHDLAGGRASALFAVLAGTTLALSSGRTRPVRGRARWVASLGLASRAVLIALLGLWLGGLDSGIAVILTYYGLLFLLGLPFLGLRAPALALLAATWLALAPVFSHWVRPDLPSRGFESPAFDQLDRPTQLISELLLTGYYPVLPWLAYLLAGMALGRSDLGRRGLQAGLVVGGLALAVAVTWTSHRLTAGRFDEATLARGDLGMFGTTPPGQSVDWLLVVAPHSATPFDLAQTIGSSVATIGGCLLLAGLLPTGGRRVLAVVFGAGTMTLTLYSLHVVMRTPPYWPPEEPSSISSHLLVLGSIGAVFVLLGLRGPLEVVVGLPTRWLRRYVGNRSGRVPVAGA